MLSLGALAFANPWLLLALATLPLLWWLLRVTPPVPRLVRFPAIRLLLRLSQKEETPAHTPIWLLILRTVLAAMIILGLAQPLLNPRAALTGSGPLVLVVDNGWAAAADWPARQREIDEFLDQAERTQRSVILLSTARASADAPIEASKLLRVADARVPARALAPMPWPTDRTAALAALDDIVIEGSANVVWLSDGLDGDSAAELAERLQRLGSLRLIVDAPEKRPVVMLPPVIEGTQLGARLLRAEGGAPVLVRVRALADDGRVLTRREVRFAADERIAEAPLELPSELRNRVARIEIEGQNTAASVVLLDERWRRRPIGLVTAPALAGHPLLSEAYYLERALGPYGEVRRGGIAGLLARPLSVLILADPAPLAAADRSRISDWIERGGVAVRFAGPRLAETDDGLVPVRLRRGGRALGGSMSWTQPMRLAPFEKASPFAGLAIAEDVLIRRQVLAEPSADLGAKTWARLVDGTPLVTAERRGSGWLVLLHTTANTEWSNLTLSGLFVDMLRRLVALSQGIAATDGEGSLPPVETLDGFGRLRPAPATATAIAAREFDTVVVGPRHPPGFYGSDTARRSLNLSAGLGDISPMANLPSGVTREVYGLAREIDLMPWLLAAALLLLLADMVISLAFRGLRPGQAPSARHGAGRASAATGAAKGAGPTMGVAGVALLAASMLWPGAPASAEETVPGDAEAFAIEATSATHLAYIKTGDPAVDRVSRAAMRGLRAVLRQRTSVEPGPAMAVDPERDELILFPFIYWPITASQSPPSTAAVERLNRFIASGGMLVLDMREQPGLLGRIETPVLRRLTRGLRIPRLTPVPEGHVLTKAFYLLRQFPGRWAGGAVWVERPEQTVNDGVSSVVVGTNDWGGAWAVGDDGRPLFAVVPGGEGQREYAFRTGINLVMYALTGNYKADQVHIPAILERLGQ